MLPSLILLMKLQCSQPSLFNHLPKASQERTIPLGTDKAPLYLAYFVVKWIIRLLGQKHLRASAYKYGPSNGTSRKIDFAPFLPIDWF